MREVPAAPSVSADTSQPREVLREILVDLRRRFPTARWADEIRSAVPEIAVLPAENGQLERMADVHIDALLELLDAPDTRDAGLSAALTGPLLRDLARWGVELEAVLRAYHKGQAVGWAWMRDQIAASIEDPELRTRVIGLADDAGFAYAQALMRATVDAYAEITAAATRGLAARQLSVVRGILEGDGPGDVAKLSARLGYDLMANHLGFVLWTDEDAATEDGVAHLERAARSWLAAIGIPRPLVLPVDAHSLWAWGAPPSSLSPEVRDMPAPPDGVRVSVGQPGRGVAGFRDTHEEALAARSLSQRLDLEADVVRHVDLETLLLLDHDRRRLQLYVRRQLGRLAERDEATAELRETLRLFLAAGEKVGLAAARGHLHRNTVTRRVEQAVELRGRPLDDDRVGLSLALEIAAAYGDRVLEELV